MELTDEPLRISLNGPQPSFLNSTSSLIVDGQRLG